jgi:hypothetical protein
MQGLCRQLRLPAAVLGIVVAGMSPRPSLAQAWIGQMVGEMAAQGAAIAREKACRAGQPADPVEVTKAVAASEQLLTDYFKLNSKSKPAELRRVFALKLKDVSWKSAEGSVPVAELGARLDEATATMTTQSFIVGGDLESARGIYQVTVAGDNAKSMIYAIDFKNVPGAVFGYAWHIWHMTVLSADQAPAPPAAYCHFDSDQAW